MVVLNRNGSFALLFLFLFKHDDLTASTAVRQLFVSARGLILFRFPESRLSGWR